ncbi:hypothetical protein [Streptomyces johnsoniae]|uniref:Anti-sigma factor n=1 Tax=Streptomyces johnsoniae TaxID=3075532 RepID=A0ABU2S775_9ACTN|nr:hypothetical protein [Streptomyces sp. DSM 41886]MDT0444834.1 hypothetical protein [Streptomyces sp. DSM 41886]
MGDRPDARELLRAAAAAHRPDRARMLARVERGTAREPRRTAARLRVAAAAVGFAVTLALATLAVGWAGGGDGRPTGPARPSAAERLASSGAVDAGSHAYWSQSNVTVETREPLTSFAVEVRVVAEAGMRPTGGWRTLPGDDFDLSAANEDGDLVFRWELRPGAEVPPGEHVFAAQYDHDLGARGAGLDRYRVTGSGPSGPVAASGGFDTSAG